jgi:hypothetical protein
MSPHATPDGSARKANAFTTAATARPEGHAAVRAYRPHSFERSCSSRTPPASTRGPRCAVGDAQCSGICDGLAEPSMVVTIDGPEKIAGLFYDVQYSIRRLRNWSRGIGFSPRSAGVLNSPHLRSPKRFGDLLQWRPPQVVLQGSFRSLISSNQLLTVSATECVCGVRVVLGPRPFSSL